MKKNAKHPQKAGKAEERIRLSPEQARIEKWLRTVKFRKTLIGGVDEADVWAKIEKLNAMYESLLAAERLRYDALLARAAERKPEAAAEPVQLEIPYEQQI